MNARDDWEEEYAKKIEILRYFNNSELKGNTHILKLRSKLRLIFKIWKNVLKKLKPSIN